MDKLFNLIRETLNLVKETKLSDEMNMDDVPGWDSLAWIIILNEIQDKFCISFSIDEAANIKTIGDIRKLIKIKCSDD